MKKRLLSLLLALVMLVSLIPTTAFAFKVDSFGSVRITKVDMSLPIKCSVTLDTKTSIECNLVLAGYSESGKLLASVTRKVAFSGRQPIDLPCEELAEAGSLATVKVFALGPDNRLLGMPYETQAYSANPTQDGGSWEYRWGEYLDWQYDNGTLTITNQRKNYPGTILGIGELDSDNPYPWKPYQNRVTTLNLVNISIVGGYAFSEYPALETLSSTAALSVEIEGFSKCPNLKTVNAQIDNLGVAAFQGCSSLEELDLRYAQSIGQSALSGTAIGQIILQNPDVQLHGGAFDMMNNLVYVSLPTGMTEIPDGLMWARKSLQVVAGLENATVIGENAFSESGISTYSASNLPGVHIKEQAFAMCDNLRTVNIPHPATLGKRAFAQANIASLTLNAAQIPEGAFTLGSSTDDFVEMAYVELIGTVSIGEKAFWRRTIGDLYLPATLETLADDAFGNTEIRVLHLPKGWGLNTLVAKAGEQFGWQDFLAAETIVDSEGNILLGGEDGDGGDITMSEETTEPTVPETTPETTPATVPETTPATTVPETTPETTPVTEAPIDPEDFDTVYVAPEGASMEEVYTAEGVAAFSGKDTVSGEKHTVKFTGLASYYDEPYVLIVSSTPGDLANLQYIDYGYADAKGQLTMTYIPKVSGSYAVQLYGPQGTEVQPVLNQDYVTLELGQRFTLEALNVENCGVYFGYGDENQNIVSLLQPYPSSNPVDIVAQNVGITQVRCQVYDRNTGVDKELTCTVEVVNKPDVLDVHLMDTKATKELFSATDNPRIYISLTKENQPVISSEGDGDVPSNETTIIKSARFADEELNNYFDLRPVDDRTLEIVSDLPEDISKVKTSYVSAIEVLAGENTEYMTTPETLKLTVKKTMPKATAKAVTINAWNPGVDVPVLFNQDAEVWDLWSESKQLLEQLGITASYGEENDYNLVLHTDGLRPDTPKQTLKIYPSVVLDGWIIGWGEPVTVNIINKPVTAKLSTGKLTLSSVNSKGVDMKLVPPKGYSIQDLGIRNVDLDSENYKLDDWNLATGSFHLTPIVQKNADYANPVPGKMNIRVTYANGVTDELPLTVATKAPTIKPKKTSFSLLNGVMDVQAAAITISPADYDLSVFDLEHDDDCPLRVQMGVVDPENPAKIIMFASGVITPGENPDAKDLLGPGIDALGVIGNSNGYVGSCKLTFDRIPGVKPFTVTVKFTKNTPTMSLKVNGTIDGSKTNKVTLTTTVKNMGSSMAFSENTEVTLLDSKGNAVDPGSYVVDMPSSDSPNTLLLYRRPEMSGQLEDGTYTVQVTRKVFNMFDEENPITLTASAKLKVKNTTASMKLSKSKVTLNPYDGKGAEIRATFPKNQYTDNKDLAWLDGDGKLLTNGEEAPLAFWGDENTITIDNSYDSDTRNPMAIADGVYYLCVTPNSLDSDAKINIIPVTVQRKALKSIKTDKFGKISLLDRASQQGQAFFLPMSEQAYHCMDRNNITATLQGSNDNRNFVSIPTENASGERIYYPVASDGFIGTFFPAGKHEGVGTLKEDCILFLAYASYNSFNPNYYANETYELYRYHRLHLVIGDGNGGVVFEQYVKVDVKDPTLKVTQSKVPTVDRRDLTKPFTTQMKFSEKSATLMAKVAKDAYADELTLWSSLVQVTNLDENGNLTLAFQDALAMSGVGKSVTIPITFYVPYGRADQTYTVNVKVNFK